MTNQKRGSAKLFHKAKKKWDPTHGAPKVAAESKLVGESRSELPFERRSVIKRPLRSKVARKTRPGLYEPTEANPPRNPREDGPAPRANPHDREPRAVRDARARAEAKALKEKVPDEKPAPRPLPGAMPLNPCIAAFQALRMKALGYPNTYEDKQLGQTLIKLRNKNVVIALGRDGGGLQLTARLPKSGLSAVSKFSWAEGASHGLARKGWVTARFSPTDHLPLRMLIGWVEESHSAVVAPPKPPRVETGSGPPRGGPGERGSP